MNIDNLKKAREAIGLTQMQAANKLEISDGTYKNYEQGKREPNNTLLCKIADLFGVTTDYLLGREKPQEPTAIDNLVKEFNLSEVEKLMVQAYFLLTPKERQNLVETAERFAEEKEKLSEQK